MELEKADETRSWREWLTNPEYFPNAELEADVLNFEPWLSTAPTVRDGEIEYWQNICSSGDAVVGPPSVDEHEGNVLVGFLPYKGPTEKARLVFAFQGCPGWTAGSFVPGCL